MKIGDFILSCSMYVIHVGGVDVFLGIQWLRSLGTIYVSYNSFMRFKLDKIKCELNGLKFQSSPRVVGVGGSHFRVCRKSRNYAQMGNYNRQK